MSQVKLGVGERRLYQALWVLGFTTWLGAFGIWLVTAETNPWFWLGWFGGVTAVIFGMAVRYNNHIWPFSIWMGRKTAQRRDGSS